MSFPDEMTHMNPDQVQRVVRDRLMEGRGVPWSEARGEPQWGLLRSSFLVWKQHPEKVVAFQDSVTQVLNEGAAAGRWGVVSEAAELCVALHSLEPRPAWAVDQWPIFSWLSHPTESEDHLRACTALLQLARLHDQVDFAWCRSQFSSRVTQLFDGRVGVQRDKELRWILVLWRAMLSIAVDGDLRLLPWFDVFRAVKSVSNDRQRERLYDFALGYLRQSVSSAHVQAAIHALEQTSSSADKGLVLDLMQEHWSTMVPGCNVALQVARARLKRAVPLDKSALSPSRLSLRSPKTSGATRWSEPCPVE